MEMIMKETQRSIKIREKRKALGDYEIYIAKDDPEHELPLQMQGKPIEQINDQPQNKNKLDTSMKSFLKGQLAQIGFSNELIQNKVVNDPRCVDVESAVDIYLEYNQRQLQNS